MTGKVVDLSLDGYIEDDCVKTDGGVEENIFSFGRSKLDTISDESFVNREEDNDSGL